MLNWLKRNGESIGIPMLGIGLFLIIIISIIGIFGNPTLEALSIALALFCAGLGLIAIGSANKHDVDITTILQRMESKMNYLEGVDKLSEPSKGRKDVTIKPPLATVVAEALPPRVEIKGQTKEEAQKRLDEDVRKVGYLRGELYQLEDGSWGIHWGGKYPI